MWAVKGTKPNTCVLQPQTMHPTPLAVNMRTIEAKMDLEKKWRTNDPYWPSTREKGMVHCVFHFVLQ